MDAPEIKKLDASVINRIAAGEIIQRPANALKEMLENSLDAKSTNIQITVKSGGLKSLIILDNGTGIRRDNLEIVCERFTTSKLKSFEDLSSMSTYGFRGEALASISHVAHLSIQTKTKDDTFGYKAIYKDSNLIEGPTRCAQGTHGTQITVEDLFYNVPTRLQALKAPNEEYQRIVDVVSRYAVHNAGCAFSLKKSGENNSIKTSGKSSHVDNVRQIYGNAIAKELLSVECDQESNPLKFELIGYVSNANHSLTKGIFLLFINHRSVESAPLKRAIDQVYSVYLPKGKSPFIYLSLLIDPKNVDVNVHPTKHEVNFLHEEEIIQKVKDIVEKKLLGGNECRKFYSQQRLPGASDPTSTSAETTNPDKPIYDKNLVRTNSKDQKIIKYFENTNVIASQTSSTSFTSTKIGMLVTSKCTLTSVLRIRKSIEDKCSRTVRTILEDSSFVGCVSRQRSVIQHETKMYLCDMKRLSVELFYQMVMYKFGEFEKITFKNPLQLKELALLALGSPESGWTEEDGDKNELAERIAEILCQKSEMLETYFSMEITADGMLNSLPSLLSKHVPSMTELPMFLLRLATEVDWDDENACFESFGREIALFYSHILETTTDTEWKWTIEFIIYPALKSLFLPSHDFSVDKSLLQIANLPDLYKVFERC